MRATNLLLAMLAFLCLQGRCTAQGFVEHFEPPVLQRGKTTRVTAVGLQFGKTLGLWASVPGVTAAPAGAQSADRAVLDVSVAADAPVGICGVRLASEDGLANACLLLIDDLPVKAAPSPAAPLSGSAGSKVALPISLWGRFREAAVDRFLIDVQAGQRVSFEAVGNRLGKDVDPLITIRDGKGKIVAERDNDPGFYFDCRFEHVFAAAGTYTVEIRDARFHGHEHGFYVLRMGRFPAARTAMPPAIQWSKRFELRMPGLEPLIPKRAPTEQESRFAYEFPPAASDMFFGIVKRKGDDGSSWLPMEATSAAVIVHEAPGNTLETGTPAKVPGMWCGVLNKPGERHYYRLDLAKGQRIIVRAQARAFNSPADLEIAITDAKGKELRRASETPQSEEIGLDFNAGTAGTYGLSVRDIQRDGGPSFVYRLDVRTPAPAFSVSAEVEGLTVPRGDWQPVPLTVSRDGYAGKIALALVGAPAGVTLTPSEIDAGVNATVCKLAASADAPLALATLQIEARPADVPDGAPVLVRTRPLVDRQLVNVDLIPLALREDQLRLPPSCTDRFALQITPASFFTFTLPESGVTLGRYQHADFPIKTQLQPGVEAKISFSAKGGQIAPKEEGRTRVYAEFSADKGTIHSKILTNLTKHRVEVTGVAAKDGRRIALTRTFELDIRAAYTIAAEPALLKLEPGGSGVVRLTIQRLPTFDDAVTVQLSPALGIDLPATVVIPRGQMGADLPIKIDPNRPVGRQNIQMNMSAIVNGFEEEQRGRFEIEVVKK